MTKLNLKSNKFIALFISIIILFTVLFSHLFICLEHTHHCDDRDHCPICLIINQGRNILSGIDDLHLTISMVMTILFKIVLPCSFCLSILHFSLIHNKIRLNN